MQQMPLVALRVEVKNEAFERFSPGYYQRARGR